MRSGGIHGGYRAFPIQPTSDLDCFAGTVTALAPGLPLSTLEMKDVAVQRDTVDPLDPVSRD